jgi:hypothetical protein
MVGAVARDVTGRLGVLTAPSAVPLQGGRPAGWPQTQPGWVGIGFDGHPWSATDPTIVADNLNIYMDRATGSR